MKVLPYVMNVPKINEFCSFMSENEPQNGFPMLSIWKMKLATWQPSWTKNSKQGDVLQWTTIDDVHAWPFSGDVLKVWEVLICAAYTNEGHCSLLTSTVAQFQARDHLGYEHKWKWLLGLKYWDLTAKRCILRNPKLAVWRPYWIWPKFYLTCIKVSW